MGVWKWAVYARECKALPLPETAKSGRLGGVKNQEIQVGFASKEAMEALQEVARHRSRNWRSGSNRSRVSRKQESCGWKYGSDVSEVWKTCDIVGRGGSGVVLLSRKVQERHPNTECSSAIKVFRRATRTSETAYQRRIDAEFSMYSSLRYQNVVRTFDLLRIGIDSLCECLEYCSGGDLHSLVVATGQLEKAGADCFFKQLMRGGVNYIHEMGIAHCDLKPENLLLAPVLYCMRGRLIRAVGLEEFEELSYFIARNTSSLSAPVARQS